jgi:hypothetical protein
MTVAAPPALPAVRRRHSALIVEAALKERNGSFVELQED